MAARRAAASLLAADQRAAASLLPAYQRAAASLLPADQRAAASLLAAYQRAAASLLAADRSAANPLLLAAHRRAATSLLVAAHREEASSLLRAATSLLLAADRPAAASMFGPVPPSTVGPQLLLTDGRTSILAQRAVLCDPLSQIRSADTTTPLTGCTSTIQIAPDSYTSRPTAAILGRRTLFSVPSLPRATTRNPLSALASAAGSILSRRGMATEAKEGLTPAVQQAVDAKEGLTPEVQKALDLMDAANAARHKEHMKALTEFEADMMKKYSAGSLSSAETALTSTLVARRVSTAVLAFGVTTLLTVLLTVENGWKSDFQGDIHNILEQVIGELKLDLLGGLREVVRTELKKIDAEKAASNKN